MFAIVEIPTLLMDFWDEIVLICWNFNNEKLATQRNEITSVGKQFGQQNKKDHDDRWGHFDAHSFFSEGVRDNKQTNQQKDSA